MSNESSMSERIARYVATACFENLHHDAVEKAKDIILCDVRSAFTGQNTNVSKVALGMVRHVGGDGTSTIIGRAIRSSLINATFVNCVMMKSLMQDDTLWPAGLHPGTMIIPTALSVGEQNNKSGREVLASIILAYEVVGKMSRLAHRSKIQPLKRPMQVFGIFGVTVAASRLFELNEEEIVHALGYAANSSMGTGEPLQRGTGEWYVQNAMATVQGIFSALLAKQGATAVRTSLDGEFGFYRAFMGHVPKEIEEEISAIGKDLEIMEVTNKLHPCCGYHIAAIELMKRMIKTHSLEPEAIKKVKVSISPPAIDPTRNMQGPFKTQLLALVSLPFSIAIVILDGDVNLERFKKFNDREIVEVCHKVDVFGKEGLNLLAAEIEIIGENGKTYYGILEKYDPTRDELKREFVNDATNIIGKDKGSRFLSELDRLESVKNISILTECLSPSQ